MIPLTLGIDTITVSFPIERQYTRRLRLPNGGFVQSSGAYAQVECSVPKRLWGENITLASAADAKGAIRDAIRESIAIAHLRPEPEVARVTRLDVARDFESSDHPARLLSAIGNMRFRRNWRVNLIRGGADDWQTLTVGTQSTWSVLLYDKSTEAGLTVPSWRLRLEARIRRKTLSQSAWARRLGTTISTISDLSDEKTALLLHGMIARVALNGDIPRGESGLAYRLDTNTGEVILIAMSETALTEPFQDDESRDLYRFVQE